VGTFTLSRTPTDEDAAAGGDLDLVQPISIRGRGPAKTTVRIDRTKVKDRVFHVLGNFTDTLQGMTISGGFVPGSDTHGDGGGVEAEGNLLRLVNDVITGNHVAVSGGGVANPDSAVDVINTTISGNIALDNGGAIRGYNSVVLHSSTLSGNHATGGGGGISSTDQIVAVNSTISGNDADFSGGGIEGGDIVDLISTTVAGNGADMGGNLNGGTSVVLQDSILARPTDGGNCHATISADHSLIDHTGGCTITGSNNVTGQDPKLGPLNRNGGPTPTMALLVGSPGINAGTADQCPDTDQRGVQRPQGTQCDIGAYEAPSPKITKPTTSTVHQATFTVAWAVPGGVGAPKFDVRYRARRPGHPLGAFHGLADHTTAHHRSFTGMFGFEYCFSARAVDAGGNLSPFGAERCVTVKH
jgi:predicted outer membrane repeat protein